MIPRRSIIPVFVPHLGCPHTCVFCNQNHITGAEKPVTKCDVVSAIETGITRAKSDGKITLAFYGGSFTAIPVKTQEELLDAAQPFLRDGKLSDIRVSTRPDCVDEATLDRLRRYGVNTVELGAQSMCPEVLAAAERGHSVEDTERAAKLVHNAGFELILQMMTGLPEDTPLRSVETAKRLIALRPDGVRIYPTVIIRDTALYSMWRAGTYKEHTVEDAVELCATLLDMFEEARIPVIRLGLNPTDSLSDGEAVGGAYHPALGELTRSRRYLRKMERLVSESDRGKDVVFAVSPGRVSAAVGQKRMNVKILRDNFGIRGVKVVERALSEGELVTRAIDMEDRA